MSERPKSKSSKTPYIHTSFMKYLPLSQRRRHWIRNGHQESNDIKHSCGSLPDELDIPDIIPSGFTNCTTPVTNPLTIPASKTSSVPTSETPLDTVPETSSSSSKTEPVWLQTYSNGMVALPKDLKTLPPLYVPDEFMTPNVGIITNTYRIHNTYSDIARSNKQLSKKPFIKKSKPTTLFTDNVNTLFPNVTSIDWSKNIIIVDLSYMTYKRFFATRTWYNNVFPERNISNNHDWCKDDDFMEKFRKLFLKNLIAQGKTHEVPETNIIFTIDCRHVDNWRVMGCKNYKSTRKESHVKNNFHNFDVFPIVRNELIADMQSRFGNLMFVHKNLEADDVVALLIKYIRKRRKPEYSKSIYIVANDRDYIQICDDKTFLIDLDGKAISSLALGDTCTAEDYLIAKMLQGDTSDNIPACYISKEFLELSGIQTGRKYLKATPSTVRNVMNCDTTKQQLVALLNKCRLRINDPSISYTSSELSITKDNQFDYNARHMDFEHIPSKYATEINIVFSRCLGF